MNASHVSKQVLADSCNGQANMHVADRSANFSLKKFSKDIKGFAPCRLHPQMVFPVWSDCSNFDLHRADVNAQMPRSAHGFAIQLFETHGSGMNSKASMCLRTFVFLLASSVEFDFTLRPKDSKESSVYPWISLRIQAM
jgi:hypothetical protein